jgi:hypothetical protein
LQFGSNESVAEWFTVYGIGEQNLNAQGFTLLSPRAVLGVFLNAHNKAVSTLLGYNNNVTSGGRDMIYYVCFAIQKQIKKKRDYQFLSSVLPLQKEYKAY